MKGGEEQPVRSRRVGRFHYELDSVVVGWREAYRYCRDKIEAAGWRFQSSFAMRPNWGLAPNLCVSNPTPSQMRKWPELAPYREDWQNGDGENLKLVWRKKGL